MFYFGTFWFNYGAIYKKTFCEKSGRDYLNIVIVIIVK